MNIQIGKRYITKGNIILYCKSFYKDYFVMSPTHNYKINGETFDIHTQFHIMPTGIHKYNEKELTIVSEYKPIKIVLPLP